MSNKEITVSFDVEFAKQVAYALDRFSCKYCLIDGDPRPGFCGEDVPASYCMWKAHEIREKIRAVQETSDFRVKEIEDKFRRKA